MDVPGLKETFRNQLRENFNRNIEIASLPADQLKKIVDSLGNILVYYFESDEDIDLNTKNEDDVKEQIKKLKFTSYNRFIHFREAFLKIRDQFIGDKDHGLDTYLSMRIRHGTLLGQIRSVFETHRLITVKNETDNEYLPNEYWLDKFSDQEPVEILNSSLSKFSRAVDEMAEKLKAETIQIKTEKTKGDLGLFDYSYTEDNLLVLFQTKFGSIRDFELFMEKVFEELWARTETCLTNIKSHLTGHMVSVLEAIFNEVEDQLGHLSLTVEQDTEYQSQQELIGTLRKCQTAIIVEMGNISEWFNRSNKKIIEEFDFRLLIDSNVSTLQNVNPSFASATINTNISCDTIFDGDLFPYFTDILYYLLENAIKHSKLSPDQLWIDINVTETNGYIKIKISNNVLNDPTHLKNSIEKIASTKTKLESEKTYEDINKEGGTGFPKIKKTLKHDLKRKEFVIKLDLDYNSNNEPFFYSEILIETAHLPTILK